MEFLSWIMRPLWLGLIGSYERIAQEARVWVERHRAQAWLYSRIYVAMTIFLMGACLATGISGVFIARGLAALGSPVGSNLSLLVAGLVTAALAVPLIILLRVIPNLLAVLSYAVSEVGENVAEVAGFTRRLDRGQVAADETPPGSTRERVAREHRLAIRFTEPAIVLALAVTMLYFAFFATGMGASLQLMAAELVLAVMVAMLVFLTNRRIPNWAYSVGLAIVLMVMGGIFIARGISYHVGPLMPEPEASVPVARDDRVDVFNPNIYSLRVRVKGASGARTQIFDLRPGERRRVSVPSGGRLRLAADYPDLPGFGWMAVVDPANAEYDDLLNKQDHQGLVIGPGEVSRFGFYDHRPRMIIKKPIGIGR